MLCAVTRLGSADLRSLIVYAVCGCRCLSSVLCVWHGALVRVRAGYGIVLNVNVS